MTATRNKLPAQTECPLGDWAGSFNALPVHMEKWHPLRSMPSTFIQSRVDQITDELPHVIVEDEWMLMVEEKELLLQELSRRHGGASSRRYWSVGLRPGHREDTDGWLIQPCC